MQSEVGSAVRSPVLVVAERRKHRHALEQVPVDVEVMGLELLEGGARVSQVAGVNRQADLLLEHARGKPTLGLAASAAVPEGQETEGSGACGSEPCVFAGGQRLTIRVNHVLTHGAFTQILQSHAVPEGRCRQLSFLRSEFLNGGDGGAGPVAICGKLNGARAVFPRGPEDGGGAGTDVLQIGIAEQGCGPGTNPQTKTCWHQAQQGSDEIPPAGHRPQFIMEASAGSMRSNTVSARLRTNSRTRAT